jgi:ferritin-like metal-binding protein YciE
MNDLFAHALRDIYYRGESNSEIGAEMIGKANNAKLKQGLKKHLHDTEA